LSDARKQELILRGRVAALKIAENTQITLEGCDEVITISSKQVAVTIFVNSPMKSALIRGLSMMKKVIGWLGVTRPTPNTLTSLPSSSGCRKIAAKEPVQIRPDPPTRAATALPSPKCMGQT